MPSIKQAEYDELITKAAAYDELERQLEDAAETIAALEAEAGGPSASAPSGTPIPATGLCMIVDPVAIEAAWHKRYDGKGQYVLDVKGEQAEFIASRPGSAIKTTELGDGTWRCLLPHQNAARHALDEAERYIRQENLDTEAAVQSVDSSLLKAMDAARLDGPFGTFMIGPYKAFVVPDGGLTVG